MKLRCWLPPIVLSLMHKSIKHQRVITNLLKFINVIHVLFEFHFIFNTNTSPSQVQPRFNLCHKSEKVTTYAKVLNGGFKLWLVFLIIVNHGRGPVFRNSAHRYIVVMGLSMLCVQSCTHEKQHPTTTAAHSNIAAIACPELHPIPTNLPPATALVKPPNSKVIMIFIEIPYKFLRFLT